VCSLKCVETVESVEFCIFPMINRGFMINKSLIMPVYDKWLVYGGLS